MMRCDADHIERVFAGTALAVVLLTLIAENLAPTLVDLRAAVFAPAFCLLNFRLWKGFVSYLLLRADAGAEVCRPSRFRLAYLIILKLMLLLLLVFFLRLCTWHGVANLLVTFTACLLGGAGVSAVLLHRRSGNSAEIHSPTR